VNAPEMLHNEWRGGHFEPPLPPPSGRDMLPALSARRRRVGVRPSAIPQRVFRAEPALALKPIDRPHGLDLPSSDAEQRDRCIREQTGCQSVLGS
jgi:hypothetical protein